MVSNARRRLARWLDPTAAAAPPPLNAPPETPPAAAPDAWTVLAQQFAWRILTSSYQASTHLGDAEEAEQDEKALDRLYRIDHAITRIRRQAENLQVLSGLAIDDAGRQTTTLLDAIRAAASAIEHFHRVRIGRVAELALVEFAADDVIRVLTELLDNATRFSPPTEAVTASAHLTDRGQVLLRIEDNGVGLDPDTLPWLNEMLADRATGTALPVTRIGLVVVQRLAAAHDLRVHLIGRKPVGTTATVLLPEDLVCEIPMDTPPGPSRQARAVLPPPSRAWGEAPGSRSRGTTSFGSAPGRTPATAYGLELPMAGDERALPVRVPGSTRESTGPLPDRRPTAIDFTDMSSWADGPADFAAGIDDAHRAAFSEGFIP